MDDAKTHQGWAHRSFRSGLPLWTVVVVSLIGVSAIVIRTTMAAAEGDQQYVQLVVLLVAILVPVGFATLFIAPLVYLPSAIRAAVLRRRFPGDEVLSAALTPTLRELLSQEAASQARPLRLTVGMKADQEGLTFWVGSLDPVCVSALSWEKIEGLAADEQVERGWAVATLRMQMKNSSPVVLLHVYARPRGIRTSMLRYTEIEALVTGLDALRGL